MGVMYLGTGFLLAVALFEEYSLLSMASSMNENE